MARPSNRKRSSSRKKESGKQASAGDQKNDGVRLNKYIARAGVSSRRKADALIDEGLVKVNGTVVKEYWYRVQPGDQVDVNGKRITPSDFVYILLNKPRGVITTTSDEHGRQTVLDLVKLPAEEAEGLFPVGRLDRDTVGVLLVTNDGDLAHRLMHPSYEIDKLYVVQTAESVKPHELEQLRRGVQLDDGAAKADQVAYVDPQDHHTVGLKLHEGRNRQVRRMLETLGHEVVALERVRYAGLTSDGIRRGRWRHLFPHEVRRLRNMVKLK